MSRSAILLMKAAEEATSQANMTSPNRDNSHKYGVSIGVAFHNIANSLEAISLKNLQLDYNEIGPYVLTKAFGNMPAAHLSIRYKLQGPSRSVNTACAASLQAIGDAFRAVQSGEADLMLAGGVESATIPWAIAAFSRIHALSLLGESRPFDRDRSGFVFAEGAGMLVLESVEHARCRGQIPIAEILGFGQACDAFSLVAPAKDVNGAYHAMKAALESAQVGPEQVALISAHATGTVVGDIAESRAIARLFGRRPLVGSLKGQLAHCQGGSGALETVVMIKAVQERLVPPNGNLEHPDPVIADLINLVPGGHSSLPWKPDRHDGLLLKNSFGLGGTNCSLVLGPWTD